MLTMLLFVAVAPAVICGVILLVTGALKASGDTRLAWSVPLAVALGVAVAELGSGTQHMPPVEASDWFVFIAIAIAVIACVRHKLPQWPLRLLFTAAVVAVICKPLFGGAWTASVGVAWCAAMVAAIAVAWWCVDRAGAVAPGFGLPAAMLIVASGAAIAIALAGSAHYGQCSGAVASALGPVAVLGLLRRDVPLLRAAWAPFMVVAAIIVAALTFVDVPVVTCVLLVLAFASLPLADLGASTGRPRWQREVLRLGLTVVLAGAAVALSLPSESASAY